MVQSSMDIETFSRVKASLAVMTNVLGRRFRFHEVRAGQLVVLPVVLVVEHTTTYDAGGTPPLVDSLKVGLIDSLHPGSSEDHFTN